MRLALLLAAPLLLQDAAADPYYKFKTGTTWTFDVVAKGKGPDLKKLELKVSGEGTGRTDVESRAWRSEGEPRVQSLRWTIKEGFLIWVEVRDGAEKDPIQLYKPGSKKGDTWEWMEGEKRRAKGTNLGTEEVKVPAGTYKDALHLQFEIQEGGPKVTLDIYLAAGVGPVKMVGGSGTDSMGYELKEFKPAK
jgi:hypothetical protein